MMTLTNDNIIFVTVDCGIVNSSPAALLMPTALSIDRGARPNVHSSMFSYLER